jgi:hypothetical protein
VNYWSSRGLKVFDLESNGNDKSLGMKKWTMGLEDCGMSKVLEDYGVVLRVIRFVGVASLSDLLTKETVFAGIEFLGLVWLEETLKELEVCSDCIRWNEIIDDIKEDIHCVELDLENLYRLNQVISDVCKKAGLKDFSISSSFLFLIVSKSNDNHPF